MKTALKASGIIIIVIGVLAFIATIGTTGGDVTVGYSTVHRDPDLALALLRLFSCAVCGLVLMSLGALLTTLESIDAQLRSKK